MTQAPARILGWQAADLAGDQRWIFAANPRLAQATEAELQAWLAPVRQELKLGWGVAWIRGLGALPEAQLRRLYLAIGRGLQARALESRDVQEHVLAAAFRLNEAEAFCRVKPFYGASGHSVFS